MIYAALTQAPLQAATAIHEQLGLAAYAPAETHRRRPDKPPIRRPLIPGYVFVWCEPHDLASVHALAMINGFVRRGGDMMPATLPPDALAPLLLAELFGAFDHDPPARAYRPKRGDHVMVNAGMWRGYIGRILSLSQRVVTLKLDRGVGKLTVTPEQLEAAA